MGTSFLDMRDGYLFTREESVLTGGRGSTGGGWWVVRSGGAIELSTTDGCLFRYKVMWSLRVSGD
ncbi:hypothetical protein TREMEDRAFT_72012 [Tremella mesenterica DSM 1558]|uniref:uncharacterized protein n=1 Tax=Tremella mesenterica (strain ATCC 24925 / CBS 8224 / DSM 1558 / NBRC 9311 / NRRL Y-6157 / RJB 2259-6 / UBC 559-6) TaxID=578456 RepID=UPI0003F49388|nr:uncharacterized protein TREMEDRAFT_72012 [Tremella mesenterica DSM 1558]EIW68490.1 hypothetical protein TREMEDRAFT_72012 [Tremella mesenterica DSM 1558]